MVADEQATLFGPEQESSPFCQKRSDVPCMTKDDERCQCTRENGHAGDCKCSWCRRSYHGVRP